MVKYWQITPGELTERKLYPLLPLQVFNFRKKLSLLYNSNMPEDKKAEIITLELDRLLETVQSTLKTIGHLHLKSELPFYDLEKMLMAIANISEFLFHKYQAYRCINEEVGKMITT